MRRSTFASRRRRRHFSLSSVLASTRRHALLNGPTLMLSVDAGRCLLCVTPFTLRHVKGFTGPTAERNPEKGEGKRRAWRKKTRQVVEEIKDEATAHSDSESNHSKKEPLMADNRRINVASGGQKESSYFGQIV